MVIIKSENGFWGFISVKGQKYVFVIALPENSGESAPLFKVDWKLRKLLGDSLNKFLKENEFEDPFHFYHKFEAFVEGSLNVYKETESWLQHPLRTCTLLKGLLKEISNIRDYVKDLDIENGIIKIEVIDAQSRTHKAVLKLSQNYKVQPITVLSHDLPLQKTSALESPPNLDNLYLVTEFCEKFLELVTHFQQFWNKTAVIDSQCCVLDPLNPTFKDTFRRIKLSDNMSVVLTFNPFCSNQMPNIKLLGRQSDVNYYQAILQKNLEDELWDAEGDLMFNLNTVLEIIIPNKIYMEESEDIDLAEAGECAICFLLTLENEVPRETCENSNCKSVYHSMCLFTYLSSIPRNRDYFGKIQGECPNCEDIIFCSVPKLI